MMPESRELIDLVDSHDTVIGTAYRAEAHARGLIHRAVHVLVTDIQDYLILQKRAAGKLFNPGRWTSTISGHVISGECYGDAAQRELDEELSGTEAIRLRLVGKLLVEATAESTSELCRAWTAVYAAHIDQAAAQLEPVADEVARFEGFPLPTVLLSAQGQQVLLDSRGAPVTFADNFKPVIELLSSTKTR